MDESQKTSEEMGAGEETHTEQEQDERDAEIERLKAELHTKQEQADKWKSRAKKGYEKGTQAKVTDADEIDKLLDRKLEAREAKRDFLAKRPDASDKRADIEKKVAENGLSHEEAYRVVMFDKVTDKGYQAQQSQARYAFNGTPGRPIDEGEDPEVKNIFKRYNASVLGAPTDIFAKKN